MKRKIHILVVEDDNPIRRGLCDALEASGYRVSEAENGLAGLEQALAEGVDLVLLDLMMPELSGLEVLQKLRPSRPTLPVIILTAMGQEKDRVHGLKLGADDYVVKPFSVRELLARVEAVLRRSPGRQIHNPKFAIPGGEADLQLGKITFVDGRETTLGEREIQLLQYLASNPGRVISRDELLLHVWQTRPEGIETRTIDMHIARLREKLDSRDSENGILKTIRGKGYMFETEGAQR